MTVVDDVNATRDRTATAVRTTPSSASSSAPSSARPAAVPMRRSHGVPPDRETHLLRLSLDLQLDAMLLVLGASAAGRPEDAMPWRRWLEEDVDLAWDLTTTALAAQGGLPTSLGPDLATADPARLTEDLLARYSSMCSLLEDLLAREETVEVILPESSVSVSHATGPAWHDQVRAALVRYQARVAELTAHQVAMARGRGDDGSLGAARTGDAAARLPGEPLG